LDDAGVFAEGCGRRSTKEGGSGGEDSELHGVAGERIGWFKVLLASVRAGSWLARPAKALMLWNKV